MLKDGQILTRTVGEAFTWRHR